MVISLDSEISQYEPFGRNVVSSIPNHKNRNNKQNHDELIPNDDIIDSTSGNTFHNDFIAAELDTTRDLFRSINDVSILKDDNFIPKEFWKLRKCNKGEEELYVNENTVICSYRQSNNSGTSFLDKSYTFNEKIIDAVWCDFIMSDNINAIASQDLSNLMFKPSSDTGMENYPKFSLSSPVNDILNLNQPRQKCDNKKDLDRIENTFRSLCVLDKYSIHILSENGDYFRKALQFEVNKIVATNYGLLLERALHENENLVDKTSPLFPIIFTLSNPLNEISPVLISGVNSLKIQSTTNVGYITKLNDYTLVSIIEDKNMVIFFCSKTSSHVIYCLRPINSAELDWIQCDLQKSNDEILLDVDKLNCSDIGSSQNLVSTPVSSGEAAVKKQCRLSYNTTSSPITRSMSNNFFCNFVQQGTVNRNSSPLASSVTASTTNNLNSPHSSRQSLSNNDVAFKRVLSPSTTKISSLISSRIDSPVSPSLNRLPYSNTTSSTRLLDSDSELRFNLQYTDTNRSSSNANTATPTIVRSTDLCVQKFSEPIIAEYTMEFVWTETITQADNSNSAASKVFVTSDFLGQFYLGFLINENKHLLQSSNSSVLKLVKFDQTCVNDGPDFINARTQYIFGTTKVLNVKDAEPLESLNMIIILDETNALNLYSGIHKVAIVHLQPNVYLSTCLNEKTDSALSTPNIKKNLKFLSPSPNFESEFSGFLSSDGSQIKSSKSLKVQASSPINNLNISESNDLSSLLKLSSDTSKLEDNFASFSIPHYPSFGKIVNLRDSIDNRVTFETNEAKLFRLSFPLMASTFLVDKCLAALRQTLPKDVAISFITSWYIYRNSTIKDENVQEVELFKLCLLSLIGYEKSSITKGRSVKKDISSKSSNVKSIYVSSPLSVGHSETLEKEITKKMKIEDDHGTDEDWCAFVQESSNLYGLNKSKLLNDCNRRQSVNDEICPTHAKLKRSAKKNTTRTPVKPIKATEKAVKPKYIFNYPGVLFPYTPSVLYTLHLLYEDLKLVQMNWDLCKSMVDMLYLLAVDLGLEYFQDYYTRDFPSVCIEISCEIDLNLSQNRSKMIYPSYFCNNPPSIFNALYSFLDKRTSNPASNDKNQIFFPYIGSGGSVTKTLLSGGAHIITPNIFNLILLYSNLNKEEFVDPQLVLQCIGNSLFLNSSSSSAYINIEKFKQIIKFYSSSSIVSFNDSISGFSIKKTTRKSQLLSDIHRLSTDQTMFMSDKLEKRDSNEKILFLMSALGITQDYIKQLPFGLALPLWTIIFNYRINPKNDWCSSIYSLIDRPDLLSLEFQEHFTHNDEYRSNHGTEVDQLSEDEESELTYLDHSVLRLLFPNDQRLQEAFHMLVSSNLIPINIQQAHGVSDHDFVEEQEKHLYALCIRTMALPLGRGMVTLRSSTPVVVEQFPIPPLVLHGTAGSRNIIELSHIDVPPNMNVWPLFHNGVSAGLRISSNSNKMVDSSWILFNKPSNNTTSDGHYAHAGFLLALGLNGLLDNLTIMDLHDYLSKGNDLTKVAILLGLAASKRGTMDSSAFILLGIHLEGLLPTTSTELDVSPIVKVAAVLGVGLLFQGTGHSYIAEVMLNEIGRPPGPEMEHYIDRESYALSAGLAFGLVTLGRGNEMMNVVSSEGISIPDQLNHYMLGVHKKLSTLLKEKNKTPSYHIREGDCINADVTSPGATLALGMMFFNTGNKAISNWLNVPDTQNLLEMVRPDFILLRVLSKNLIMWSEIKPTSEWIESHIPSIIYKNAFQKVSNTTKLANEIIQDDIDYETMTQSYCNIIAGACFALALRYAGSADPDAFDVVQKYTVKLVTLIQKGSTAHIEQAGRSTIESCVNVLIVSCSIIMAGTGNVEVMRLCRFLRSRINQAHVLYGSFMAIHMALGLLFLGGCRVTLNSSPESVAALICAFFPKYPIHTYDNRYHLQAFRHLYVLATEPRLLIPRCIDTGMPVYATIHYTLKDQFSKLSKRVEKLAPCLLPDLNLLESVELVDNSYWNISFESRKNFNKLWKCLQFNGNLYIKRKVKGLSYNKEIMYSTSDSNDSKDSLKTILHKMDRKSFTLFDFTNEVILKIFSEVFISNNLNQEKEILFKNKLCSILYECAEDETLELFVPLIKLITSCSLIVDSKMKSIGKLSHLIGEKLSNEKSRFHLDHELDQCTYHKYFTIWQIKFASLYISQSEKKLPKFRFIDTIRFQIEELLKKSVDQDELRDYLQNGKKLRQSSESLIDTVVYHNLPPPGLSIPNDVKFLNLLKILRTNSPSISTGTVAFIKNILK